VLHDPDAGEERRLGTAVADHVDRRGRDPIRAQRPQPDQEDPHVADGGEREQALEVVLEERHRRAEEGGQDAGADQDRFERLAVAAERPREDGEVDTPEPVQAELAHRA
jgi:hypothetical protein